MTGRGVAALAGALLVLPAMLGAQVRGLPVVNNGFTPGVSLRADAGFANASAGGGTTFGLASTIGSPVLALTASVSRGTPDGHRPIWSQGLAASVVVFGGPLVPFRVTAQAGAAFWELGPRVTQTHVPVSLGLSATIPNPAFAIRPWLAPRYDFARTSADEGSTNDSEFAMSGGIELGFINGLRIHASYDRIFAHGNPGILAVGLGYAFGG